MEVRGVFIVNGECMKKLSLTLLRRNSVYAG